MSRRAYLQKRLTMLGEITSIMGAMKNISLMETHKLQRFLTHQRRVVASIEGAMLDFVTHSPKIAVAPKATTTRLLVAIGSQRGFCGDFNGSVARAVRLHLQSLATTSIKVIVVGRRLASKLNQDSRIATILDAPSVVEEVQRALRRLMDALAVAQTSVSRTDVLDVVVCAHREGEGGAQSRPLFPDLPAEPECRFAYPALLNLATHQVFRELREHYLWARMHDVFYCSLMAENRLRLQHMEGATRRIGEKCDALRRGCNTLRQEEITEEIEVIMLSNESSRKGSSLAGSAMPTIPGRHRSG